MSTNGGCTQALTERIARPRAGRSVQPPGRGAVTEALAAAGIDVLYDASHKIAHNKVMIFDGAAVATGSFNFSAAAERSNAENLLIVEDAGLVAIYAREWQSHRQHAKPAAEAGAKPQPGAKRR